MSLPEERARAIEHAREFLFELLRTTKTPKSIRQRAYEVLKHYPTSFYDDAILKAIEDLEKEIQDE